MLKLPLKKTKISFCIYRKFEKKINNAISSKFLHKILYHFEYLKKKSYTMFVNTEDIFVSNISPQIFEWCVQFQFFGKS